MLFRSLFHGLEEDLVSRSIPVVVFQGDRYSLEILGPALDADYRQAYSGRQWPGIILWLPRQEPASPASLPTT